LGTGLFEDVVNVRLEQVLVAHKLSHRVGHACDPVAHAHIFGQIKTLAAASLQVANLVRQRIGALDQGL